MIIQLTLILSTALGTITTLTCTHWLTAWIGLELNTLAFVPLIIKNHHHPRHIEAAVKYLLIQSAASATILFCVTMNAVIHGNWDMGPMDSPLAIPIALALCMKLGLAPLHFWYADVLMGVPLVLALVISTWQKIAPMTLLIPTSFFIDPNLLISMGLLSVLIGGWGGINQTQLRKILAYSSIAHMGWIIIILKFDIPLAQFTFLAYLALTAAMFTNIITLRMLTLTQFSTAWAKSPPIAIATLIATLSLAGMPPLAGFAPKLMISLELAKTYPFLVGMLSLLTLLSLFFYLRLIYAIILTTPLLPTLHTTRWRPPLNSNIPLALTNLLGIWILPFTPLLAPLFS